ncbi:MULTISPECIES: DUF3558 domain-containing protein [unclassified Nocardia]|uniref:DUF3558 domain-containing protein n=1 Tax=unclassified Nocardia TaxID=2637762 RepID=UPI001CE3C940|nr:MULTISPECIES: DUF3558 domain-containing protein [unclassified Nocardia]
MFVLAGCGSSKDGTPEPTSGSDKSTSSAKPAPDVPAGYNACKDVPQSILDSEQLTNEGPEDSNAPQGGIIWRGCMYLHHGGYASSIQTTNATVDAVRDQKYPETTEFTIGSRRAISTRRFVGPHIKDSCTVDVEMKGGSLEVDVNNPPDQSSVTKDLDACDIAKSLAQKIAPTLPAGA